MKSCLRNIFLFVLIVGVGGGLLLGYLGLIPKISEMIGSNKPYNLMISFTKEDLKNGQEKTGVEIKTLPNGAIPGVTIQHLGQHSVFKTFTSEETTALANNSKWKNFPFSQLQIKFNKDKSIEVSGKLLTDKIVSYVSSTGGSRFDIANILQKIKLPKGEVPFYIATKGEGKDNKIDLSIDKIQLGKITVPKNWYSDKISYIESFVEERIKFVKGLSIKSLKVEDGNLKFDGTLPDFEAVEK